MLRTTLNLASKIAESGVAIEGQRLIEGSEIRAVRALITVPIGIGYTRPGIVLSAW